MTELWRKLYAMTEAEAQAEQAEDLRRIESGEMSDAEIDERTTAWRRCGEEQTKAAEFSLKLARLAKAAGCPNDKPVVPWLVKHGLMVKTVRGYAYTPRAKEALQRFGSLKP